MKKNIFTIAAIIACGLMTMNDLQAQQGQGRGQGPRRANGNAWAQRQGAGFGMQARTPEARVNNFARRLSLSDVQKASLLEYVKSELDAEQKAMEKMREEWNAAAKKGENLSREERNALWEKSMKENQSKWEKTMEARQEKLKAVLTEDQYKTCSEERLDIALFMPNMPQGGGMGPAMSPEQRIERLASVVKLSDSEKEKCLELMKSHDKKLQELRDSGKNMADMREEMNKLREDQQAKMKELLGEERYAEYEKIQRPQFGAGGMEFGMRGSGNGQGMGPAMSPEQRVERLASAVKLSDSEKEKCLEIMKSHDKKLQELRNSGKNMADMREEMNKLREDQQAKMKELLGEERYAEYQKIQRPQTNRNGMGRRTGNPPPGRRPNI